MTTPERGSSSGTSKLRSPSRATRILDAVLDAGGALAGVLIVGVMLLTAGKVVFRYVLGQGLIGVDQISGTLVLYATFLGAAWVLRHEGHVTIDLLFAALDTRTKRRLDVVNSTIGALICLVLTVYGTLEVVHSWRTGILIPAEIEIPRAVNLAVIPLGSFLLFVQFVRRALRRDAVTADGRPAG